MLLKVRMKYPQVVDLLLKSKYIILLLGILFFHLYMNYEVIKHSEVCLVYDEANRMIDGLDYYNVLFKLPIDFANIKTTILNICPHPPFLGIIEALILRILETANRFDEKSLIFTVNAFLLAIVLCATYKIGSILYNKKTGLLAAFFVSFFPMIHEHMRSIKIDFALAAAVTLSFLFLFKTDQFRSLFYSICLGVILGFSQLTKESFPAFFFIPAAYFFYKSYKLNPCKTVLLNAAIALFIAFVIAGGVYLRPENFPAYKYYIGEAVFLSQPKKSFFYYFQHSSVLTGGYFIIAVLPLLVSYFSNLGKRNKFVLLWLVAPFIIYTLSPNKECRFLTPLLPALALISAGELSDNKLNPLMKKIFTLLMVVLLIAQFFAYFSGLITPGKSFSENIKIGKPNAWASYRQNKNYSVASELIKVFRNQKAQMRELEILFIVDVPQIQWPAFIQTRFERLPFYLTCPIASDEIGAPVLGSINWEDRVLKADYLVDRSGDWGFRGAIEDIAGKLHSGFNKHRAAFEIIGVIPLPEGEQLIIYKKIDRRKNDRQ